ncbi:MAG: hypothetical protein V3U98_12620 [Acidobacteriota bacterium]
MKRFVRGMLALSLVGLLGGAFVWASDTGQATVGDLVDAIATAKKVGRRDVESFLTSRGVRLDTEALLSEQLAAELFRGLGLNIVGLQDRPLQRPQADRLAARLAPVISIGSIAAEDALGGSGSSGHGTDEVRNRGVKARRGGRLPNSNANVNAFESIREDPL